MNANWSKIEWTKTNRNKTLFMTRKKLLAVKKSIEKKSDMPMWMWPESCGLSFIDSIGSPWKTIFGGIQRNCISNRICCRILFSCICYIYAVICQDFLFHCKKCSLVFFSLQGWICSLFLRTIYSCLYDSWAQFAADIWAPE